MDKKYSAKRYSKYKEDSKDRLSNGIKKRIQTTMIGAISSIEEHLGFLWTENSPHCEEMKELFFRLRSEILDKGNYQMRNIDAELAQYDVELLRFQIEMPVKPILGDKK
jgi:hypothetical protein